MDLKRYFYHNIIAIDQLFNALTAWRGRRNIVKSNLSWSHISRTTKKALACTLSFY